VCSDAMTRGMDVEGVHNVINYDAPVYVKTYVHRAGRTARAGGWEGWYACAAAAGPSCGATMLGSSWMSGTHVPTPAVLVFLLWA